MDKIAKALGGGEGGTGGGSFVIHVNEIAMDNGTKYELDKTWQEISDAIDAGMYCCVVNYQPDEDSDEMGPCQLVISGVSTSEGLFCLAGLGDRPISFSADTKDGYPYDFVTEAIMPGDIETPDPGIAN